MAWSLPCLQKIKPGLGWLQKPKNVKRKFRIYIFFEIVIAYFLKWKAPLKAEKHLLSMNIFFLFNFYLGYGDGNLKLQKKKIRRGGGEANKKMTSKFYIYIYILLLKVKDTTSTMKILITGTCFLLSNNSISALVSVILKSTKTNNVKQPSENIFKSKYSYYFKWKMPSVPWKVFLFFKNNSSPSWFQFYNEQKQNIWKRASEIIFCEIINIHFLFSLNKKYHQYWEDNGYSQLSLLLSFFKISFGQW